MNPLRLPQRLPLRPLTPIVALCACLSAGHALAAPATARQMPIDIVAPLLADDGSAYACAQREPVPGFAAGVPAPGCATRAQRHQLQRLHPGRVVRLRATGPDMTPPKTPARDAWVFVEGAEEHAARLARRLVSAGVERVWVMLPERVAAQAQAAQARRRSQP